MGIDNKFFIECSTFYAFPFIMTPIRLLPRVREIIILNNLDVPHIVLKTECHHSSTSR